MKEHVNYISDEELEQLILQVEQEELVTAPPDLMENILHASGVKAQFIEAKPKNSKKKEFYAYCFRVITSVAAAVALVFLLPQMTEWMGEKVAPDEKYSDKQKVAVTVFVREEMVKPVPDKATVVAEVIPTKEEVLEDTGVVERIIRNAEWFNKTGSK